MKWLACVAALVLCMGATSANERTRPPASPTGRALILSDIHFDPLADPAIVRQLIAAPADDWPKVLGRSTLRTPSGYGSDSNYPLLESTLSAAAAQGPFDFVLYTGDSLRHDFATAFAAAGGTPDQFPAFAQKTQTFVIDQLETRLRAPVMLALGNDDSACGDYALPPSSAYLAAAASKLSILRHYPAARKSFALGGYYALPHPVSPKQTVIVLNSVFWSPKYAPCIPAAGDIGAAEILWLKAQLATARSAERGVTLVMHIPPGMDAYASAQGEDCAGVPLLDPRYADELAALLARYSDIVKVVFAGHTHMDDFRLPETASPHLSPAAPVRITPSVSPIFGNNPSFSTFLYHRATAAPIDLVLFNGPLKSPPSTWQQEYRFAAAYHVPAFDRSGVRAAIAGIAAAGPLLQTFVRQYAAGATSPIRPATVSFYTCAQNTFTVVTYQECACSNHPPSAQAAKHP